MEIRPGQRVGAYTVAERLGQGGMSNVFLAEDPTGKQVVLKFPHQEMLGDIATHERFSREVKIGQLLDHPNIQRLVELVRDDTSEYLVLEFVPGQSLRRFLRDRTLGPGDVNLAVRLGNQIGSALAYAHEHHVAHRDLKPENIIVTPDMTAKVMDFGIALLRGARRVTWGPLSSQVGTPDYMAPEQIQGARGDARTDVYALGMILYEVLAGRLPYDGDNALAVMNQHVNVPPPPIHRFRKDVPAPLEEIVMKAIRIRAQDRWQSMPDMIAALDGWREADAQALRSEREQLDQVKGARGLLARLPAPISPATLVVVVVVVGLIAVLVIAASLAHPHGR